MNTSRYLKEYNADFNNCIINLYYNKISKINTMFFHTFIN